MTCPQCQGEMRIIAFLTDYGVVDRIINHLNLTFVADKPPPSQVAYQQLLMAAETGGEYFLQFSLSPGGDVWVICGPFGAWNSIKATSRRFQAVLDIFLSLDLPFPSMIDGKVESKTPTRPAKPKTKFLFILKRFRGLFPPPRSQFDFRERPDLSSPPTARGKRGFGCSLKPDECSSSRQRPSVHIQGTGRAGSERP